MSSKHEQGKLSITAVGGMRCKSGAKRCKSGAKRCMRCKSGAKRCKAVHAVQEWCKSGAKRCMRCKSGAKRCKAVHAVQEWFAALKLCLVQDGCDTGRAGQSEEGCRQGRAKCKSMCRHVCMIIAQGKGCGVWKWRPVAWASF